MRLSRASGTNFSYSVSNALVASSRRRMEGFFRIPLAVATLCFWPSDNWTRLVDRQRWSAEVFRFKSSKTVTSGLIGYLNPTFQNSVSPDLGYHIRCGIIRFRSIDVFLWRISKSRLQPLHDIWCESQCCDYQNHKGFHDVSEVRFVMVD
ncbi:hypothetical protein V6N13_058944 [Hibiscus sabdariffa]